MTNSQGFGSWDEETYGPVGFIHESWFWLAFRETVTRCSVTSAAEMITARP